jgi:beta-hydroxylase
MKKILQILCVMVILIVLFVLIVYLQVKYNGYRALPILNKYLSAHCVSNQSVFDTKQFAWTNAFRNNWITIFDEYRKFNSQYEIPNYALLNSHVASCDLHNKWKALFLRAFNKDTTIAQYFPQTMNLINQSPCTLAFFSVLEPGALLEPHYGLYKGVIRYHLALSVPKEKEKCFLQVDGKKLIWSQGQDLMFDDLFLHSVENNTNETRIILFLDIKRDFNNWFLNFINTLILFFIKSNDALDETIYNANTKSFQKRVN